MNYDESIRMLEQTKSELIRFMNELDKKLARKEIDGIAYHIMLNEKLGGKTKEEIISYIDYKISEISSEKNKTSSMMDEHKRRKIITFSAAAIILLILMAIIGVIYTNPGVLTGYTTATKEVQEVMDYNRVFDHYTETQLTLNNLTGLKISGVLEGTGAKVKLRINGTNYLIAQITNPTQQSSLITGMVVGEEAQYELTTDKTEYAINETATITLTPDAENKSLYIAQGESTQKLESNTYTPTIAGDYQVIALVVLPDNILRLDTNFTVTETAGEVIPETTPTTNETNQTNETTPIEPTLEPPVSPNTFTFENLCTETCSLPENANPILIVELDENTTLTLTTLTATQTKENLAPEQTKNIPDISLAIGESTTLNLNDYFTDPENDLTQYDINEIPEINANINQNELTITSTTLGAYTAYIYATDGDKLVVSNTFQIMITEVAAPTNQTNETSIVIGDFTTCDDPNPNKRPPECMEGNEDKYFKDVSLYLQNLDTGIVARITSLGNMVIKGRLIEASTASPGSRDFRISYLAADGETRITTAWIDSTTGDLHLRGRLYEEQFKLLPTGGDAFIIQNKKGTNLLYFERETGNLYLRGNLISERPQENIITE